MDPRHVLVGLKIAASRLRNAAQQDDGIDYELLAAASSADEARELLEKHYAGHTPPSRLVWLESRVDELEAGRHAVADINRRLNELTQRVAELEREQP